ncbi:AAA family ATPase [Salibacterium aidingense]|uniref:AAA family ATPase n=1 Tax=Salibacterium aidingense TaxID=384933 RepID=UPI000412859E|nr:MinD/ParA family protein [Salibacterium aidingense]
MMYKNGEIIAVSSMKGGVGKTEVSLNLAAAIKKQTAKKVVVIDFDIPYGGVSQALGSSKEGVSLSDWVQTEITMTERQAKSLVIRNEEAGIDYIPAIADSNEINQLNGKAAKRILEQLIHLYDYVIVDSGVDMGGSTKTALLSAQKIVLVSTVQQGAIYNNYQFKEDLVSLGADPSNIVLFLNQVPEKEADVSPDKIEELYRGSGSPVETVGSAAYDHAVRKSRNNRSFIYLTKKKNSFTQAIDELTQKLGFLTLENDWLHEKEQGFFFHLKKAFAK